MRCAFQCKMWLQICHFPACIFSCDFFIVFYTINLPSCALRITFFMISESQRTHLCLLFLRSQAKHIIINEFWIHTFWMFTFFIHNGGCKLKLLRTLWGKWMWLAENIQPPVGRLPNYMHFLISPANQTRSSDRYSAPCLGLDCTALALAMWYR